MIKENITNHNRRYIFAAFIIPLLIIAALVFILYTQEQPDPDSVRTIRQTAAAQLTKDPNNPIDPNGLTDEDFAKIIEFNIMEKIAAFLEPDDELFVYRYIKLSDIKLLEKFVNLQELKLNILYPETAVPEWMKYLAKLGVFDINKRKLIDLRPLKKLTNLQKLDLSNTGIPYQFSVGKFSKIVTKTGNPPIAYSFIISQSDSPIQDITPLSGLINLKELNLNWTRVTNLEPIENLKKLQKLSLTGTKVSDLEPIKSLINLQELKIEYCENINDEQIEDLQKALPNLKIDRTVTPFPSGIKKYPK